MKEFKRDRLHESVSAITQSSLKKKRQMRIKLWNVLKTYVPSIDKGV
jgi:hypothetical protein